LLLVLLFTLRIGSQDSKEERNRNQRVRYIANFSAALFLWRRKAAISNAGLSAAAAARKG